MFRQANIDFLPFERGPISFLLDRSTMVLQSHSWHESTEHLLSLTIRLCGCNDDGQGGFVLLSDKSPLTINTMRSREVSIAQTLKKNSIYFLFSTFCCFFWHYLMYPIQPPKHLAFLKPPFKPSINHWRRFRGEPRKSIFFLAIRILFPHLLSVFQSLRLCSCLKSCSFTPQVCLL